MTLWLRYKSVPADRTCTTRLQPRNDAGFVKRVLAWESYDYLFVWVIRMELELIFANGAVIF
jgi:hypothetical protein